MFAEADFEVSAAASALTVAVIATPGATYSPLLETVPISGVPPGIPFTCQWTVLFEVLATVAVNCCCPAAATVAAVGDSDTFTEATIDTLAEATFEGSAWGMAATDTTDELGATVGAVYSPDGVIVPVVELPPTAPFTCQVTAAFKLPVTVAVNCSVAPASRLTDEGEMETDTPANDTCAEADFEGSAWGMAVTDTAEELGTTAGAVYRPDVEIVPVVELPPTAPFTCQVTAVFELPITEAANCWVAPV